MASRRYLVIAALSAVATLAGADRAWAQAGTGIGRTAIVVNRVLGTLEQSVRELMVNDGVFQDERVATESNSASEIVFRDGTTISLGPDSEVFLDRFVFDPNAGQGGALAMRAVRGVFRFVSGTMSGRAYSVETPTATIGIRGTDFSCRVGGGGLSCMVHAGAIDITDKGSGRTYSVERGASQTVGTAPD